MSGESLPALELAKEIYECRFQRAKSNCDEDVAGRLTELHEKLRTIGGQPYFLPRSAGLYDIESFKNLAGIGPIGVITGDWLYRLCSVSLGPETQVSFLPDPKYRGRYTHPRQLASIKSWTPLSDFFEGSLGFRGITWWTSFNLENEMSPAENARLTALSLGLYSFPRDALLLRVNVKASDGPNVKIPTEGDGVDYLPFFQASVDGGHGHGFTLDLRDLSELQLGKPEYVVKNADVDEVEFFGLQDISTSVLRDSAYSVSMGDPPGAIPRHGNEILDIIVLISALHSFHKAL